MKDVYDASNIDFGHQLILSDIFDKALMTSQAWSISLDKIKYHNVLTSDQIQYLINKCLKSNMSLRAVPLIYHIYHISIYKPGPLDCYCPILYFCISIYCTISTPPTVLLTS
jgi:hypothetical protein